MLPHTNVKYFVPKNVGAILEGFGLKFYPSARGLKCTAGMPGICECIAQPIGLPLRF